MMTKSQPPRDAANQDTATIRALSSITAQQADIIAQDVQASGLAWTVQTTDDYDGYLSILIAPGVDDGQEKSFFISGTAQRLELFEAYQDNMVSLANFSDAEAVSARLMDLIAPQ